MEEIYDSQTEIYQSIQKLFINIKKDGEERRSMPGYYRRKLETLQAYWDHYQQNHKKLAPFCDKERPYFARNEYELTKQSVEEIKSYIGEKSAKLLGDVNTAAAGSSKQGEGELFVEQVQNTVKTYQTQEKRVTFADQEEPQNNQRNQVRISTGTNSKLDDMLRNQFINFKAFMRSVNSVEVDIISDQWELKDTLSELLNRWRAIDNLHWEIEKEADGDINDDYQEAFSQHEMTFLDLKKAINIKLHAAAHREQSTPQIEIPTFTGNYQKWKSFSDQFIDAIHSNSNIPKAQKMQHLKSKIRGEPEKLIQHLTISAENYLTAWELLQKRYANNKIIFQSYLNEILNLPNMQIPSLIQLQKMHDVTFESLEGIKNLGVNISTWDPILEHILALKLDPETHDSYLQTLKKPRDIPNLQDLLRFFESKFSTLEQRRNKDYVNQRSYNHISQRPFNPMNQRSFPRKPLFTNQNQPRNNFNQQSITNKNQARYQNTNHNYNQNQPRGQNTYNINQNQPAFNKPFNKSCHVSSAPNPYRSCPLCQQGHGLFMCPKFIEMNVGMRSETVSGLNVCRNCLYPHYGKPCYSPKRCRFCQQFHNSMLHETFATQQSSSTGYVNMTPSNFNRDINNTRNMSNNTVGNIAHVSQQESSEILLSTALLNVKAADGTYKTLRALVDQGSQISLITENAAQLLGLKRQAYKGIVFGIGERSNMCKGMLNINCQSTCNEFSFDVQVFIMNNLIKKLPNISFHKPTWEYIHNITLADPEFYISRPVDILLGADIYANIILEGIYKGEQQGQPLAQQTHLGWILCGSVLSSYHCNVITLELDNIHKFWEIEEVEDKSDYNIEDQKCVQLYNETTKRREDGRYVVRMPLHEDYKKQLGSSKETAFAQYRNLERKFMKEPTLASDYKQFIIEYRSLGHMKLTDEKQREMECFLPHHAVQRAEAITTKLRVVFNASSRTSSGKSLNDVMYKGPNLQQDLQELILKWRQYQFAYTADVTKFYRQIFISEEQQPLQQILWRDSPTESIKQYQLTTVTYGTKAAQFLAMMTLKRLASEESDKYPDAAKIVQNSMYTDDLVTGAHSIETGKTIIYDLCQIMKSGGFTLRKWSANNQELLKNIKDEENIEDNIFTFKSDSTGKTLGIIWNSTTDKLSFKCNISSETTIKMTKRKLLAEISKIFDPLGWLSPITIKLKILFQRVWIENLQWDDVIPDHIYKEWVKIKSDIHVINQIEISRWIGCNENDIIEFHGFCDASINAFAATVYARIKKQDQYSVILVAAKTKVAPNKKPISLPRLELCGAYLLSKLITKISKCYSNYNIKVYGWTDSMVVLGWINGDIGRWKTFVSNRVKHITEIMKPNQWRYIKTNENPADAASRGLSATQLKDHKLWWNGPDWLSLPKTIEETDQKKYETNQDIKIKQSNSIQLYQDESIIFHLMQKHNSFIKIVRILAWIQRAIIPSKQSRPTYITLQEIYETKRRIIKYVQNIEFYTEIECLRNNKVLKSKSNLLSLNPYLDKEAVLRVGGRLRFADLSYEEKHPVIIPHTHRLTELIIEEGHLLTYHGGVKLTLSNIRRRYWIIGGVSATKKYLRNCVTCRRHSPEIRYQLMGDLPPARVNPAPPFFHTGVDYTGFVDVKLNKGRGARTTKGYIVVFVCMVTKAVHLEIASDLTSEAFLAALRRMSSRRGCPRHLYSDNGSNFVKANRVLQEAYIEIQKILDNSNFYQQITNMNIEWHFIAPAWPTAGGLWERNVRSLKYHIKRSVGEQKLTFEEYSTLLSQLEACLNSRPLCALSENIEDLECLTPAHFLTGRTGLTVIDTEYDARTRWHLITKIHQDIWKKWKQEYLTQLSVRNKWVKPRENIKIDDIVIIKDENLPAGQWAMGRVTELHPGSDGLVRVVTLKTKGGYMKRPISKIAVLPINKEDKIKDKEEKRMEESHNQSTKEKRKKKSPAKFLSLALTFVYFMTMITSSSASYNVTTLNINQSLYFDPVAKMHHIRDEWTLIVYYNMSPYWKAFTTAKKIMEYLNNLCEQIKQQSHCNMILSQLRHDHLDLKYYNQLLMNQEYDTQTRKRRGLINGIGYIANELFGVLDERFAEKYTKDIQLIRENQKHLLKLWQNQTSVIESEFNLIKRTEEIINTQHKIINKHLGDLDKSTNYVKEQIQNLSISEDFALSSIAATHMLSNLRKMQETLLDTLIDTYHGRFNIHLLTPTQLLNELHTISGQLKEDLRLPLDSIQNEFHKIYQLLQVKGRMTKEYFIFETKFPLVSRDSYDLYKIIPIHHIIEHNIMWSVVIVTDFIAINVKKDAYISTSYEETQKCLHYDDSYLCTLKNPVIHLDTKERFCKIKSGENKCHITKETCEDQWRSLHDVNTYLYFACSEINLRIICADQITNERISNTGLIRLGEKCIAKGRDFTFYSHDHKKNKNKLWINKEEEFIPMIAPINHILNIPITSNYTDPDNYTQISKELTSINQQINNMKQKAESADDELSYHDVHQYAISYTAAAGVFILAVVAACWRLRDEGKGDALRSSQKDFRSFNFRAAKPNERQPISLKSKIPTVVVEEDTHFDDVIDLGAPRVIRNQRINSGVGVGSISGRTSISPRRYQRAYVPNPRLYPGPQQKPKKLKHRDGTSSRHRKNGLRRPVPNSRLYRPAPPRTQPPPLQPRTTWLPPTPARALDTASRVAFSLGERRRARNSNQRATTPPSTPFQVEVSEPVSRSIVVTLPQATTVEGGDSPEPVRYRPISEHFRARERPTTPASLESGNSLPPAARIRRHGIMEPASRHSTSPEDRSDGNETLSAPSEFLAEFLSAIMRRQYAEALKYCRLILQYEPQNATARGFYPLLQNKVQFQRQEGEVEEGSLHESSSEAGSSKHLGVSALRLVTPKQRQLSSSEASTPPQVAMEQEADSGDSDPEDAEEGSAGSVASQSSLELDSSEVLHSSPSLSFSRHTDSASGCMWESTGSASRSDADDNGNTPAAPSSLGQTTTNSIHPGDVENDNAAGEPGHTTKSDSLASLRRLRAHFACSIK